MGERVLKGWGIICDDEPSFDVETGPRNPRDFWFDFRIDVEETDRTGVSSYQFFVSTPLGLMSHFDKLAQYTDGRMEWSNQYVFGKGLLLVREYSISIILEAVNKVLAKLDEYAFDLT